MREGIKPRKGRLYLLPLRALAFSRSTSHVQRDANRISAPSKNDNNCSVPEVSFCRPVYLQPRSGVLATKESLLRLWCDLGARQPFIWRRATRAGTPTCAASRQHFGLASPAAILGCGCDAVAGLSSFQNYNAVRRARAREFVLLALPPSILRVDLPEGAHIQLFSLRLLHVARTHRLPDTNAAGCGLGCHYTKYPDAILITVHDGLTCLYNSSF